MRFILAVFAVLTLAGCGEMGPPGVPGPEGPPGPSIPILTWVDSTDRIVSTGPSPFFIDTEGLRWIVDPDSGELTLSQTGVTNLIYYELPDCAGPGYIKGENLVGVGFSTCGDAQTETRVRGPHDTSVVRRIYSAWTLDFTTGECRCIVAGPGFGLRAFPLPARRAIPVPPTSFAGPLHQVFVPQP
jgi:hypothetical protein